VVLDHIPEKYLEIWNEKELLWASMLYDGELSTVRARYIEIEREPEHEPRGERRIRLVNELFGMKRSNRQDHPAVLVTGRVCEIERNVFP